MPSKLRAAVIGCGGIANNHIAGYLNSGRYEMVALADVNPAAMAEKNERHSISPNHYTDARQMLEQERPDVVSICVWHGGQLPRPPSSPKRFCARSRWPIPWATRSRCSSPASATG